MNKTYIFALAALLAAPLAIASVPPIKDFCEDPAVHWDTHKYYGGTTVNEKTVGLGETGVTIVADTNISGDCDGDTVPGDFDGHYDTGIGGAVLTVVDADPNCQIEAAHHGSSIHVEDRVLGFGVSFTVGADSTMPDPNDPTAPEVPGCDGVTDNSIKCTGWCTPPFPPGADGAYWVFVHAPATKGTITGV